MRLSNLSYLLLAIPATLAAQAGTTPPPSATPNTPTMGIYGRFDIYMGYQGRGQGNGNAGTTGASSVVSMDASGWCGSRFGFTASEPLGGNYKMNLDLENGFMTDSGALANNGILFSRQCWAGISGDFGEIRFGRQNTVQQVTLGNTDCFDGATYGSFFNNFTGYNSRMDNVVGYRTPKLAGGLVIQAMWAPSEQPGTSTTAGAATAGTTNAATTNSPAAGGIPTNTQGTSKSGLEFWAFESAYTNGPLYAVYNFETQRSANAAFTVNSSFAAVTYNFGFVKAYGAFYRGSNVGSSIGAANFAVKNGSSVYLGSGTANTTANTLVGTYNDGQGAYYNGYQFCALAPLTKKLSVGALYGWAKDMDVTRTGYAHNDASEVSGIAQFWATPNVLFYGVATVLTNKNNAAFKLTSGATNNPNQNLYPAKGQNEVGAQIGFAYYFGGRLY